MLLFCLFYFFDIRSERLRIDAAAASASARGARDVWERGSREKRERLRET